MPNVFTRVPAGPVPPLPAWARHVLPVADLFMVVMLSRPPGGTLGTAWVTPATLQLSAALAVCGVLAGVLLVAGTVLGASLTGGLLGVALLLLGAGAAAVAAVGLAQRRSRQI